MNRDRLTRERRSWNMSRIRGKHTAPELIVRSLLHRLGYRFRIHKKIPIHEVLRSREREKVAAGRMRDVGKKQVFVERARNKSPSPSQLTTHNSSTPQPRAPRVVRPDIVLPKYKTAIFVHGCFWHRHRGCKNCTTPTHRREFWAKKFEGNAAREKVHQRALRKLACSILEQHFSIKPGSLAAQWVRSARILSAHE